MVSDLYDPDMAEQVYGMGNILGECDHLKIPTFNPVHPPIPHLNLYAFQRLLWVRSLHTLLEDVECDVVFATQSTSFKFNGKPVYHFLYDIQHLFTFPSALDTKGIQAYFGRPLVRGAGFHWQLYYFMLARLRDGLIGNPKPDHFLAVSSRVQKELTRRGFKNCSMIYPPARLDTFHPREKRKQIVLTARLDPAKNIEGFFQIARRLPHYHFILVARDTPVLRSFHKGYAEKLLATKPVNVEYVNRPIREVPELLEESQVYLYTGVEPGIGIAIMEACGAGCVPIANMVGGGAEVVDGLGAGFKFRNFDDAARKVKLAMEDSPWDPIELREKALKAFSPDVFMSKIQSLVN